MCAAERSSSVVYCFAFASYCFFTSSGSTFTCAESASCGQQHVLDARLLGRLERGGILVVEVLHLRIVDLYVLHERFEVDGGDLDLALLLEQPQVLEGRRLGDDVGRGHRLLHGAHEEILPQPLLEHRRRHVLRGQHLPVAVGRKLAVVLERRDRSDELLELRVGDAEALVARLAGEQPLVDEHLEQREAHLGIVEHRGIEVAAHLPAHLVALLAQRVREFLLRDLVAADRGHGVRAGAAAEVVVDAEEGERHHQQGEDDLRDALVFGDQVEHAKPSAIKKGERCVRPGIGVPKGRDNRLFWRDYTSEAP